MFTLLIIFFASSLISFFGSLQLGPVNLFVIDAALYKSKKAALLVAFGGVLPEIVYCSLAVLSGNFIQETIFFQVYFKIFFILVLIVLGFYFMLKKSKQVVLGAHDFKKSERNVHYTIKGFSLAIMNPQLLPFWVIVLGYFNTSEKLRITNFYEKISFILGSAFGAFLMLIVLMQIVLKFKDQILDKINTRIFPLILSFLFFAIAFQQIYSLAILN